MQWNGQKTRLRSVEQGDKEMVNSRERAMERLCKGMLSKQKQETSQPSRTGVRSRTRCGVVMGLRPSQQPPTQSESVDCADWHHEVRT